MNVRPAFASIATPWALFLTMPKMPRHPHRSNVAVAVLDAERLETCAIWLCRIGLIFSVSTSNVDRLG
jgi:hypothetical protein